MKGNATIKALLVVASAFAGYYALFMQFTPMMDGIDSFLHIRIASYLLTYFIAGIPLFAGTILLNRRLNFLRPLGLQANAIRGFVAALVFAFPMLAGSLLFFRLNTDLTVNRLIAGTLLAGFFEELYFRGFLFGQLYRNSRLGFIPAVLVSAVLFAAGHLYQSSRWDEMTGIFLTTFMGAVFFAWLYLEWDYNLWVPVFLHFLMNLSWIVADVSVNAMGGPLANLFRGLTIALAIIGTILWKRRKGIPMEVRGSTLVVRAL